MKVFVSGATGFIGSRLAEKLAGSGKIVHALVRSEKKAAVLNHPNILSFKGDILDEKSLELALDGCREVYHIAAFASVWTKDPSLIYHLNIEGAINVIRAALKTGAERIVFTSTAGVHGSSQSGSMIDETSNTRDLFTHYDHSKAILEKIILAMPKSSPEMIIVNPTRVYGPGILSESNAVTKMIDSYRKGRWRIIPGSGEAMGNYVYIDNVVEGIILAMEKGRPGEKYLLGGENASYNHFFSELAGITGLNIRMFRAPGLFMSVTANIALAIANITGGKPFITPELVKKFNQNFEVNSNKAITQLGYNPGKLKEGLNPALNGSKKGTAYSCPTQLTSTAMKNDPCYALVTGASSGIGKAIAMELASRGLDLLLVSLPGQNLMGVEAEIKENYGSLAHSLEVDLSQDQGPKMVYEWAQSHNYLVNILVNNAGCAGTSIFELSEDKYIDDRILVNIRALVLLSRYFIPDMKKMDSAFILNVGSLSAWYAIPFKSIYAASKAFVVSFSRALRTELKGSGISISVVNPNGVKTNEGTLARIDSHGKKGKYTSVPVKKVAQIAVKGMFKKKFLIIPGFINWVVLYVTYIITHSLPATLPLSGVF